MQLSKKNMLVAAFAGVVMLAGSAHAATTTLAVSGAVTSECQFVGGPYTMAFGVMNPSANVDASTLVRVGYQCSSGGATSAIKVNGASSGSTVDIVSGTNKLPVHLMWTAPVASGTGTGGTGTAYSVPLLGKILAADIASAKFGAYIATYNIDLLP